MANSTPSRPGFKTGGTAGNLDLYLDLFGGEVLTQYETSTIMRPLHRKFELAGGKSLRMPVVGSATANYHIPGTELTGGQIAGAEVVLTPDDQLIADVFLADIDEKMSQIDARSAYAEELGRALAKQFDGAAIRTLIKAARDPGTLGVGGSSVLQANAATDMSVLFDCFSQAVTQMDLKDVDVETQAVHALVDKVKWYGLARTEKMRNRDYNPNADIARAPGTINIDGVIVHKSGLTPFGTNDTTHPQAYYRVNATNTVGLVWTQNAIATSEVKAVWTDVDEQKSKRGSLLMAGYMSGTRVYRAAEAVEIKTA